MTGASHEQQTSLIRKLRKGLFFEPEVQLPIIEYRSKKIHNLPVTLSKIMFEII